MDLPIKAGDVLNVDDANSSGDWWYGCNQEGRYGYFPSNFVKEVSGSPSSIEEKEKLVKDMNELNTRLIGGKKDFEKYSGMALQMKGTCLESNVNSQLKETLNKSFDAEGVLQNCT